MNISAFARLRNSSGFSLTALLILLCFSNRSLGATGSVRPSYWSQDKSYDATQDYFVGSTWVKIQPEEISGYNFVLEGFLDSQDLTRSSFVRGEVREAFVEKSFGILDLRIGRQIIVWGRADKANPTDNFSSKDYTFLMTDDEDQRLGQTALQSILNFENFRLITIWQPEWRFPKYPIAPNAGIEIQNLKPKNPQNQFGVKFDRAGGETDWSISYFDGYNKTPDLKVLSVGPTVQLGLEYGHIQVLGADFARVVGDFGIRGEAAYMKTQDDKNIDALKQNSNLFAVLGADRTFKENLNINAQALYRRTFNFQDPNQISDPNTRLLATQQAITSNQLYEEQLGFTLRPSFKALNETLEIEMAYVTWLKNNDSILRPKTTYAITDNSKLIIGGEIYSGPSNSFFGRLKSTSSFFTEFRYLF